MLKSYEELFLKHQSFIKLRSLFRDLAGMIFPVSIYLVNMVGVVWLFNNATLDNKNIIFYIFLVVASVQAILQEKKISLMKEKIEEMDR